MVERCRQRPIAYVAAEAQVAGQTVTKGVRRFEVLGEAGSTDCSSAPPHQWRQASDMGSDRIKELRREYE